MIDIIVRQYDKFKYVEIPKDGVIFDFLKEANVNMDDPFERLEAIGFYHGFMEGYNGNNRR